MGDGRPLTWRPHWPPGRPQSLQYPPPLGGGALPQLLKFSACHPKAASDPGFKKNKPKAPLGLMGLAPALRPGPSWLLESSVPGSREWSPGRQCPSSVAREASPFPALSALLARPEGRSISTQTESGAGRCPPHTAGRLSWGAWRSTFLLRQKLPANSKALLRCMTQSRLCFRGDFTCPGMDAAKGWGVVPACPAPLPGHQLPPPHNPKEEPVRKRAPGPQAFDHQVPTTWTTLTPGGDALATPLGGLSP